MANERYSIYRNGNTADCAITGAKTLLVRVFPLGAQTCAVVASRATGESTCILNVSLANGQPIQPVSTEAV